MRIGLNSILVSAMVLSALSPAMAFMPGSDPEPSTLNKLAPAGLSLRQASALAGKAMGFAVMSENGASVRALDGNLTGPAKGSAKDIAASFVNGKLATDKSVQFAVGSALTSEGDTHVRLVQKVDGLEIFGPDLLVHVNANGSISSINGTAIENTTPINSTKLSADAAVKAAVAALGQGKADAPAHVLFPSADGLRHAWKLELSMADHRWVTVVDAQDGSILLASDQIFHVTGTGSIYRMDPLHGDPSNEPLENLKGDGNLNGSFADVRNEKGDRAKADDNKFIYAPDNTHFDEANVYFHVEKVHAYWNKMGFKDLDKPMVCTVHVGDQFDNAYFDPRSGTLNFGDGNRLNDLSKDCTVAYHEYTHAVTNAIVGMMMGGEGGGLHEGYSDYFAGTITDDPVVGAYAGQRLPSHNIRNMDNKLHYPEDSGSEPHKAGAVWGGAVWDVRKALGPEVADKIVHQSRYFLPHFGPKFADAYQGILKADKKFYNGAHAAAITDVFTKRGIAKAGDQASDQPSLKALSQSVTFQELSVKAGLK